MNQAETKDNIPHISLWRAYREKCDSASFETLVKRYMHLVTQMANRLSTTIPQRSMSKEDLVGLGYIGLIEAIQHFDYTKGYQFETFGLWRIKGAMLDGVRQMDWIPRSFRDRAKKLNQAVIYLEQKLLRTPTVEEIAEQLNLPIEETDYILSIQSVTTLLSLNESLNSQEEEGKKLSLIDQVIDSQSLNQEQHLNRVEFKSLVAQCIDQLPEKEKLVISLLYYEELTQVEIAEVLNLSKGRISQIHSLAILHLRQAFESKGLEFDFFN